MDSEIVKSAKASTLKQILTSLYFDDVNNKIFYECFTKAEGDFLENIVRCNNFISDDSLQHDEIKNSVIEAKSHVIKTLIVDYMKKCIKENYLQRAFDSDNQNLVHDLVNNSVAFDDNETIKNNYGSIDMSIFTESRNEVIKELLKEHYRKRYKKQDYSWIDNDEITTILKSKIENKRKKTFFERILNY